MTKLLTSDQFPSDAEAAGPELQIYKPPFLSSSRILQLAMRACCLHLLQLEETGHRLMAGPLILLSSPGLSSELTPKANLAHCNLCVSNLPNPLCSATAGPVETPL